MSVSSLKLSAAPFHGLFAAIVEGFHVFAAAASAAHAVDMHRKPAASDLRTLGIDPKNFTVRV